MDRCVHYYGLHASLFFVVVVVGIKYVLENCMIACFIFIYNSLYWELIKEDSSRIYLNFDKTTREKKTKVNNSIFGQKNQIQRNHTQNSDFSDSKAEAVFGKTKTISNFLYVNRAVRLFKGKGSITQNLINSNVIQNDPYDQNTPKKIDIDDLENISEQFNDENITPPNDANKDVDVDKGLDFIIDLKNHKNEVDIDSPDLKRSKLAYKKRFTTNPKKITASFRGDLLPDIKPSKTINMNNSFHIDSEYTKVGKNRLAQYLKKDDHDTEETRAKENSVKHIINPELALKPVQAQQRENAGSSPAHPELPDRLNDLFRSQKSSILKKEPSNAFEKNQSAMYGKISALGASSYLMSMNTLRHPKIIQWVTRTSYLRLSVTFSMLSVLAVLFSTKANLCNLTPGYQAIVALFWIVNAYFICEHILVVYYSHTGVNPVLQQKKTAKATDNIQDQIQRMGTAAADSQHRACQLSIPSMRWLRYIGHRNASLMCQYIQTDTQNHTPENELVYRHKIASPDITKPSAVRSLYRSDWHRRILDIL